MVKRFSERTGIVPEKQIQIESMDEDLRNSIRNVLLKCFWSEFFEARTRGGGVFSVSYRSAINEIYEQFFKLPISEIDPHFPSEFQKIDSWVIQSNWYHVYDFLEQISAIAPRLGISSDVLTDEINKAFERECSGYRMVKGEITPNTNAHELSVIQTAIDSPIQEVSTHIKTALKLFSDRQSPDYRNSVKESISAVECAARVLTNDANATLGKALRELQKRKIIDDQFKDGVEQLYAWTNSDDGVRHGLKGESGVGADEARFMLVLCSGLSNYLVSKSTSNPKNS